MDDRLDPSKTGAWAQIKSFEKWFRPGPPMEMSYFGKLVPAPGHPDFYNIQHNKGKKPPWKPVDQAL